MNKNLACPASCCFTHLLLVVSFLFPTSLMGDINPLLPAGAALVNLILLLMLVAKGELVLLLSKLSLSTLLLSLIVFYTLISEFDSYAWGQIFYLLPLLFLVSTSPKISLKMPGILRVYYIASFFVILLGYSILLRIKPLTEFVVGFYSYGYADLVPRMIELGKPVSIFGSHSIAAMYFYLIGLLAVYIQARMQGSRLINIFIVFSIIVFLTNLQSASSAFFLMLSFVSYSYVWLSSRFSSKSLLYLFVFFCLSTNGFESKRTSFIM